jgi:site-specific DNA recombinase
VCELLNEPERLREEFERRQQNPALGNTNAEADRLRAAIGKSKRGISRLLDVYTEELVDNKDFEARMRRLQGRLAKLEASLKALNEQMQQAQELRVVFSHFQEFADQMKAGLTVPERVCQVKAVFPPGFCAGLLFAWPPVFGPDQ